MANLISLISVEKNDLFQRIKSFVTQLSSDGSLSDMGEIRQRPKMISAGIVLPPFNDELWLTVTQLLLHRIPHLILDRQGSQRTDALQVFLAGKSELLYYAPFRDSGFYDPSFHFLMSVRHNQPIALSLGQRQQRTSLLPIVTSP